MGVRLPGADGRSDIVHTIPEQAAVMLDALDSTGVKGPYRLLGWSTGGLLAWEIAQLLLERGDSVEMVALIDTYISGIRIDNAQSISEKYRALVSDGGVAAAAGEGLRRASERTRFAFARRRYRGAVQSGEAPDVVDAERQLGPVMRQAALDYHPEPLDARVLYVSASESPDELTVDPWAQLQYGSGNFLAVEIDGAHFVPEDRCIVGPHGASELVRLMNKFLDR